MGRAYALLEDLVNLALENVVDGSMDFRLEGGLCGRSCRRGTPLPEKTPAEGHTKLLEEGGGNTVWAAQAKATQKTGETPEGISG